MRIAILSDQRKFSRNFNDFFPLYKWRNKLSNDGLKVDFFYNHTSLQHVSADIFIVSSRYPFPRRDDFKIFFNSIKKANNKIVLFDASDTSGIVDFDLIDDVDAIIKKQVLKNTDLYTENNFDLSVRPWLLNMPLEPTYSNYIPCPANSLFKIKVGWNLGLCDYRYFPSYTGMVRNYFITDLPGGNTYVEPTSKNIFTSYRGSLNYGNKEVSYQRNKVLEVLSEKKIPSLILGGKIKKALYLAELKNSKIGISPFGWGEICYRDFEIILNKGLLIKPDMSHLVTFPDIYLNGETYISTRWDMTDLAEKVDDAFLNYERYQQITKNAYERFMAHQNSYTFFGVFFKQLIDSL